MSKERLCLCMLTRNDENHLKDCIQESRPFVDEIIIADLGSSDHTVETAKQSGAVVYQIEWKDDFSAAKNFCLDQAKGRWVLFLQPNERVSAEQWKEVAPLLDDPNAEGYLLYTDQSSDNFKIISPVPSLRLFRNRKEYRFQYKSFEAFPEELITNIKDCRIRVRRLDDSGFHSDARSLALLQEELNEHADSCYLQYMYGIELINQCRYYDSIQYFRSARGKLNPDFLYAPHLYKCYAWSFISLERDTEAFEVLEEGIKNFPYYTDLLVLRAELYKRHLKYEEAIRDLENSLRISEHRNFKSIESEISPSVILENLGELYEQLSDDKRALLSYQQALVFNPENQSIRITVSELLYRKHEYSQVLENLEYLESCLGAEQTDSIRFSCYEMLGESEKAEQCFSSIRKGTLLYPPILLQRIEDDWIHDRWQEAGEKLEEMEQTQGIDPQVKALYHLIQKVLTGKEHCPTPFEQQDAEIISELQEKFLWFNQVDKVKLLMPPPFNEYKEDTLPTHDTLLQRVISSLDLIDQLETQIERISQKNKKAAASEYSLSESEAQQAAAKTGEVLTAFYRCFISDRNSMKEENTEQEKEKLTYAVMHCEIGKNYEKSGQKKEAFRAYLRVLQWNPADTSAFSKVEAWYLEDPDQYQGVLGDPCWTPEGLWFHTHEEFIRYINGLREFKKQDDKQIREIFSRVTEFEDSTPEKLAEVAGCKNWIIESLTEAVRKYAYCERFRRELQRVNQFSLANSE